MNKKSLDADKSRGLASEQVIDSKSLTHGEECWISNGVRGFIPATIRLF